MRAELVGASRAQLLETLRTSASALSSQELAAACGLHVTTVRFHLEILAESGLVEAHLERRGRGRPRLLYRFAQEAQEARSGGVSDEVSGDVSGADAHAGAAEQDGRTLQGEPTSADNDAFDDVYTLAEAGSDYRGLAMLLAAHWEAAPGSRATRAQQAGRASAALTSRPLPGRDVPEPATGSASLDRPVRTTMAEAAGWVSSEFAARGFAPEMTQDGSETVIELRSCPFIDVARAHPDVVCALHLGLLQGTWEQLSAPPVRATLHPFQSRSVCVARLAQAQESSFSMHSPAEPDRPAPPRPRSS